MADILAKASEEEAARKDEKPNPLSAEEAVVKACEVNLFLMRKLCCAPKGFWRFDGFCQDDERVTACWGFSDRSIAGV